MKKFSMSFLLIILGVMIILASGCGAELKLNLANGSVCTISNPTPLMIAVANKDHETITNLLDQGVDLNETRKNKWQGGSTSISGKITAMNIANEVGDQWSQFMLMKHGANSAYGMGLQGN